MNKLIETDETCYTLKKIDISDKIIEDVYIENKTGNLVNYVGWKATDYIDVSGCDILYLPYKQSSGSYNFSYDSVKNAIKAISIVGDSRLVGTLYSVKQDNAHFIRLSCRISEELEVYKVVRKN